MRWTQLDPNTLAVLAIVAVLGVLALSAWLMQHRRHQSQHLRQRFGPEYTRTVDDLGSQEKAEAELLERERRVQRLHIVALAPSDASRYAQEWKLLQSRFVDDPRRTLAEVDRLVRELMLQRGYPMADFERRAADISVDHANVVEHYRAAHDIALRDQRGETSTEDLRQAVVHYHALFDDLLEVAPVASRAARSRPSKHHLEG
jgi:hypothetical protein